MSKIKNQGGTAFDTGRKSGRAVFDKDGRGIWEWQTSTGVFERHISDDQLLKLEASELSLVESAHDHGVMACGTARSRSAVKAPAREPDGKLARLFKRFNGKG